VPLLPHVFWQLEVINLGAGALLSAHGVDLEDAAYTLDNTLPMIISVQLNTSASRVLCGGERHNL
jgi:hypothetical protein